MESTILVPSIRRPPAHDHDHKFANPRSNSEALAALWKDFIDWKGRRRGENGLITTLLRAHGCHRIFDAALGDGCDAIHLAASGFDVFANELDPVFERLALHNLRETSTTAEVSSLDWRELPKRFGRGSFDAVLCLGNSLTLMVDGRERDTALQAFRHILRPGGILLIDERNYRYVVRFKNDILSGNFEYKHSAVYCGTRVDSRPIHISQDLVVMRYVHQDHGMHGILSLYPFQANEVEMHLHSAGFQTAEIFSDYCQRGVRKDADFFLYLAIAKS
jgi:SAM-dependent methyltransferase